VLPSICFFTDDEYSSDDLVIGEKRQRTEKTVRLPGCGTSGRVPRSTHGGPGGSRGSATKLKTTVGKNEGKHTPLLRKKKMCSLRMLLRFMLVNGGPYGKTILIALQKGPTLVVTSCFVLRIKLRCGLTSIMTQTI
jgi:hypothetical protein